MAKYTEHFHFEPSELALIEDALRREISLLMKRSDSPPGHSRVKEVNQLLGKIFHQKKFYSQVNSTGIPAG
jgi:hypothetical protein